MEGRVDMWMQGLIGWSWRFGWMDEGFENRQKGQQVGIWRKEEGFVNVRRIWQMGGGVGRWLREFGR